MTDADFIEVSYFIEYEDKDEGEWVDECLKDFVGNFTDDVVTKNLIITLYEKGLLTNDELFDILDPLSKYGGNIKHIGIKKIS